MIYIKRCAKGSSRICEAYELWEEPRESGNRFFQTDETTTLKEFREWASKEGETDDIFQEIGRDFKPKRKKS